MTVALICAMPMELKALVKKLSLTKGSVGGQPAWTGSVGPHEVVATSTGMGTKLAHESTERLFGGVTPERVIVFGITGGIDNDSPIGTLVHPEVVLNSNTGTEHRPEQLGDHTPRGVMWTTDVMTPPAEYPGLIERGVISLDMETAAIAACCEQRGIPWSVFRVISDQPSDEIDDEIFHLGNQDGSPNFKAVAKYFLRHPLSIPKMLVLGKGASLATRRAAEATIAAVEGLP